MSILCSTADAISSGSCPILFKVLTLNVAICSVCLYFSSFGRLSSVADFSNTEARAPTSAGRTPFFTRAKSDAVCVCGLSVGHGYLLMAVLFSSIETTLIEEQQYFPDRTNDPERNVVKLTSRTCLGIEFGCPWVYSNTFTYIMLLPMCT